MLLASEGVKSHSFSSPQSNAFLSTSAYQPQQKPDVDSRYEVVLTKQMSLLKNRLHVSSCAEEEQVRTLLRLVLQMR